MKKIKSSFILKIISNSIIEKKKLELFKYNKFFQNKIKINLTNYQHFSGKYIIYESKDIGKIYNGLNDTLIYEGGYVNGKRNGKGKEYHNGELIFKGMYNNGKRNGKGKEYRFGKFIFEGMYIKGERNGKGREYNDGELIFKGLYSKGKRNGKGKEYKKGKLIYEGNYEDGEKSGIFKHYNDYYSNNFKYKEYSDDITVEELNKEYNENRRLIFEGEYLNGEKNGKCKEYNKNGKIIFEGEYLNGMKWNGKGFNEDKETNYAISNENIKNITKKEI